MNDPENFLKRWSRRKGDAADKDAQPAKTGAEQADKPAAGEEIIQSSPGSGAAAPAAPKFDVSSLPSIDSIDASTDISLFMRPGVPSALRHAALRRAWLADPAIRDFVGPNENYWDVAGPEGVPGFGDLDPNLDIKRLVSEVFGEPTSQSEQSTSPQIERDGKQVAELTADNRAQAATPAQSQRTAAVGEQELLQRTDDAAVRNEPQQSQVPPTTSRRHGGAMPQ